jgi:thiamine biosynthesis lipoprotein ApbE
MQATWEALGTSAVLRVTDPGALAAARAAVEAELERVDRACSRFRTDSELARVNASAGTPAHVGPDLAEALEVALRAAEITGGDVTPTLGAALVLAGYDRDFRALQPVERGRSGDRGGAPADAAEAAPRRRRPPPHSSPALRPAWRAIELDRRRGTVCIPPGVSLDLGSTAKAWAADRAASAAHDVAGCGVLVSLGGDIATAGPPPGAGWRVHVTEDHRAPADAPGQTIAIRDGGLATSSTTVRRWRHRGREMHHILDPRTGLPVEGPWRTVAVAAGSCADANVAATAAIVRGEGALAWLSRMGLPARLIARDGAVRTVGGWPAEPVALAA